MSIGTATLSIVVDRANMKLTLSGVVHHRNLVALSVTSFEPTTPGNLTLMVYRGATRVCNPPTLTGSPTAQGSLDTDTDKMIEVFANVPDGAVREFDVRLWDAGASEFIGVGVLRVLGTAKTYQGDTGTVPVVPVPGPEWDDLLKNFKPLSVMHVFNPDDGKWYPITERGVGDERRLDIGSAEEGVVI